MAGPHFRSGAWPDELVAQRRRLASVVAGLQRLSARDRKVLVQLVADAYSLRELTARLGIPRTALQTQIVRARRRLAKRINVEP